MPPPACRCRPARASFAHATAVRSALPVPEPSSFALTALGLLRGRFPGARPISPIRLGARTRTPPATRHAVTTPQRRTRPKPRSSSREPVRATARMSAASAAFFPGSRHCVSSCGRGSRSCAEPDRRNRASTGETGRGVIPTRSARSYWAPAPTRRLHEQRSLLLTGPTPGGAKNIKAEFKSSS